MRWRRVSSNFISAVHDVDTSTRSARINGPSAARREGTAVIPRRPLSALTTDAASHGGAIDRPRQ